MAYSIGSAALISTRRRCGFSARCQRVSRRRAQFKARLKLMVGFSLRHILESESLQPTFIMARGRRGWSRTVHNLREDFFLSTAVVLRKINFSPGETARAHDIQGAPLGKLQ